MKKDKKFLLELENQLNSINKKNRDAIVLKYRNIIDEKLNEKKKIKDIIRELGNPEDVAKKEISELKNNKKSNKFKDTLSNTKNKTKNALSKVYKGITKDIQIKPKDKKEKVEKKDKELEIKENYLENIKSNNLKEEKIEKEDNIKVENTEKENNIKEDNKKKKEKQVKEKTKKEVKVKEEKNKKKTEENKDKKESKLKNIFKSKKDKDIKEEKDKKEYNIKNIFKKDESKKESKFKSLFKKEEKGIVEEVIDEVEETFDDVMDEVSDAAEIISNKPIFMSKKERRKNIILKVLGLLVVILMLIIWLWINVIFVASLFAFLDGVRIIGINITLFGLSLLVLWSIIMLNKLIFRKKNKFKLNLFITLFSVLVISVGIGMTIYQLSKIEEESDVTQKYNMTTKYDTYNLPSKGEKMYIMFNSNYDTQYIVKYDDKLEGKFKLEVKYFENYYDYHVKKSTNNIYVSLSRDTRDRISSYIDDIKENKIYKEDELSRYTVKITINEKDFERLIIEN